MPWYGGKRRWVDSVWSHLVAPDEQPAVYAEPFAGSLALLLAAPWVAKREVVCDTDGLICNFWRALRDDPEAVAYWADWPTIHQDLTARHRALLEWRREHVMRLSEDADFSDAKMAGWWVWGLSSWIGGGWCIERDAPNKQMPFVDNRLGGQGVQVQRDRVPHIDHRYGGKGVQVQRGQMPFVHNSLGGRGVQVQRTTRPALLEWFRALSERLHRVVVLNRSWESALTPTVLGDTSTCTNTGPICIVLDPPYLTAQRHTGLYGSDADGSSDDVARASFEWAVAHGDRYRIAYFAHEGDFQVPEGWASETKSFGLRSNRDKQDMVMYSPACARVGDRQIGLFA